MSALQQLQASLFTNIALTPPATSRAHLSQRHSSGLSVVAQHLRHFLTICKFTQIQAAKTFVHFLQLHPDIPYNFTHASLATSLHCPGQHHSRTSRKSTLLSSAISPHTDVSTISPLATSLHLLLQLHSSTFCNVTQIPLNNITHVLSQLHSTVPSNITPPFCATSPHTCCKFTPPPSATPCHPLSAMDHLISSQDMRDAPRPHVLIVHPGNACNPRIVGGQDGLNTLNCKAQHAKVLPQGHQPRTSSFRMSPVPFSDRTSHDIVSTFVHLTSYVCCRSQL